MAYQAHVYSYEFASTLYVGIDEQGGPTYIIKGKSHFQSPLGPLMCCTLTLPYMDIGYSYD